MDGSGAGVSGANVRVDGQERCVTDENGYYKLDQVFHSWATGDI